MMHSEKRNSGYTSTVDWWSLGIMLAKLLTGQIPFQNVNVAVFVDYINAPKPSLGRAPFMPIEYTMFFDRLAQNKNISESAVDIIRSLLIIDPHERLGCGSRGIKKLKAHNFFSGIDWEKLEQKNVTPPFVPESKPLPEAPEYSSIEDMLRSLGHAAWITAIPTEEEQRYYATW